MHEKAGEHLGVEGDETSWIFLFPERVICQKIELD